MLTNYVLVDFENVQPESFRLLAADERFRLMIFVGSLQSKLPFEIASSVHRLGTRAEYVKVDGSGPNALDFHIAYTIGVLATTDPKGSFHIISKDTGFDPLIRWLRERKIQASRVEAIDSIPTFRASKAMAPDDRVAASPRQPARAVASPSKATALDDRLAVVVENLRRQKSPPKSMKTLRGSVTGWLRTQKLTELEVSSVINALKRRGYVAEQGKLISIAIPSGQAKKQA